PRPDHSRRCRPTSAPELAATLLPRILTFAAARARKFSLMRQFRPLYGNRKQLFSLILPPHQLPQHDTRSQLPGGFDLAIGNPPFADRIVRADPTTADMDLRLHDYFIARSIMRLRPGGLALFVTSTGTMDKVSPTAREHIAGLADLIGAVRLPEGSMRASAGTDVVVDVLVFQRRADGEPPAGEAWVDLAPVANAA